MTASGGEGGREGGDNEIQAESRSGGKKLSVGRSGEQRLLQSQGKKPRPAEISGTELLVKENLFDRDFMCTIARCHVIGV